METPKNDPLWQVARKRAEFKQGLTSYVLVNAFLVVVWYVTIGRRGGYFWPIWPILGWGIGVLLQYLGAYHGQSFFSTEAEYERLRREQEQQPS